MVIESIVPQSAGSLSVAILGLMMAAIQVIFLLRKPQFSWYGWSAAISLSAMIYASGNFGEYNTLAGQVNRYSTILEYTAIVFLIHCFYGFSFAYLGSKSRLFHVFAGIFHCLVLVLLWTSTYIISDRFVGNNLTGLVRPYIQPELGPLGPAFLIYCVLACAVVILIWIRHKSPIQYRNVFISGMIFWLALGIHDVLLTMGVPTFLCLMEYGFLGFSIVVLWVVFNSYVDISGEDKYRVIAEFIDDGILVIQDGKTVFANPSSIALFGHQAIASVSEDLLEIIASEDREKAKQYFNKVIYSDRFDESLPVTIKSEGREEKIVEIRASKINYRDRRAVLMVIRDITERVREETALRESEERLNRSKKMESIGRLAGGVAHDLNNVLSGIVSYPDLILMQLPKDSHLIKPIETIREAGKRSAAIVQDLLTIARGAAIPKNPLNLNDMINEYFRTPEYKKTLQNHPLVTVKCDLDPGLMHIKGSQVHIVKIIMNLISNSCEAIEGHGNVLISTANRYLDRPLKTYDDVNSGEYAVLSVKDDGLGMSSDDLKRIFEPFFTKKVMGKSGTGLGLTIVWNCVQDHDGYIDVISGNEGTKFEVYFPVTRESLPEMKSSIPLQDLVGHCETILVIDDVRSQRDISCRMLEALGYKTKAVPGGDEAVEYIKGHRVDLLLLDMIMDPGIDGRVTYERIKKIRPDQKAIIVSGFAETELVKETIRIGAGQYLKKPFVIEELGLAVKKELLRK